MTAPSAGATSAAQQLPSPLERWAELAKWAGQVPARHGAWDLGLAASRQGGLEARGRVAYGLTGSIEAMAEAWAARPPGLGVDYGVMAGIAGRW